MMHILHVVGARPNFVKVAPVFSALAERDGVRQTLVHTGQHYDVNMSDVFFRQLGIPQADVNLEVGSGSHAKQTAEIMTRIEPVLLSRRPDLVLVYGDVNSTVAAALVCAKLLIPVGHVEAGLRSFDRTMPEEVNRVITDQISSVLFTPSEDANENLAREGIAAGRIHFVGNVMIDSLVRLLPAATKPADLQIPQKYALVTLHRPANVDDGAWFKEMLAALDDVSRDLPVIFPVHPRTRERIASVGNGKHSNGFLLCDPVPYLEFLYLQKSATVVITDSGGIQEETTYLGVPCLTVRENTERPVTVELGTNVLVGRNLGRMRREVAEILRGKTKNATIPPFWDAHTAERLAGIICRPSGGA
jgi:UDP-N-acetylglucosamine 2-epimerase (non-hydrolysing)